MRQRALRPALHRRPVSLQRDEVVADGGNLLDQGLAGRVVPAVNGVGMVGNHQCEAGLPTEAIGDGSRSRPAPRRRFMRASSRRSSPASVFH
jgi:hypothetical protein